MWWEGSTSFVLSERGGPKYLSVSKINFGGSPIMHNGAFKALIKLDPQRMATPAGDFKERNGQEVRPLNPIGPFEATPVGHPGGR